MRRATRTQRSDASSRSQSPPLRSPRESDGPGNNAALRHRVPLGAGNQAAVAALSGAGSRYRGNILDLAPKFREYALAGRYNLPLTEFRAGTDKPNGEYHEISTWNSEDFNEAAGAAQRSLIEIGEGYPDIKGKGIISLYGKNSIPFNNTILGYPIDSQFIPEGSHDFDTPEQANSSVKQLIHALDEVPSNRIYDVGKFTNGIASGMKSYRGMITRGNGKDNLRYAEAEKLMVIPPESLVQNRTFMSTSASPSVAAEFMLRQRDEPQQAYQDGNDDFEHYDAFNPRRIVVEFDHSTGRNIAPYVPEPQAEVLFNVDTPFKVAEIRRSDIGYIVHVEELSKKEANELRDKSNSRTWDIQYGDAPLDNDQLNTRKKFES